MDWTRITVCMGLMLLTTVLRSKAQEMELGVNVVPGIAYSGVFSPGMNGFSLDADYIHTLGDRIELKGGLELGLTGWGSQVLMSTGARWGSVNKVEMEILNGMALYQQGPNYVFGAGAYYCRSFFQGKKNQLLISGGLRYTIQPAYKTYSSIYTYFDLPLRFRWTRSFK